MDDASRRLWLEAALARWAAAAGDDEDEELWPFVVITDQADVIPAEHYCADHLIGERGYLSKHALDSSAEIWLDPQDCCNPWPLPDRDGEPPGWALDQVVARAQCDEPGCLWYRAPQPKSEEQEIERGRE